MNEHTEPAVAEDRPGAQPPDQADFTEVFERARRAANRGDQRAQEALKQYLDGHPEAVEHFGDLARIAEEALLENASAGEFLTQEACRRYAAKLREKLNGPAPSALESLAIERVVASWLGLQNVRIARSQARPDFATQKYWDAREEQVYRLYDAAVRSLALVRGPLAEPVQFAARPRIGAPPVPVEDRPQAVVAGGSDVPSWDLVLQPAVAIPVNRVNGVINKVNGHGRLGVPVMAAADT